MASKEPETLSSKVKAYFGLSSAGPGLKVPKPVQTQPANLPRQDSFPEICSTPSEIGFWEVAHNKDRARGADGKINWKKFFFEAPGRPDTPRSNDAASSAGAAASAAAGAAAAAGSASGSK